MLYGPSSFDVPLVAADEDAQDGEGDALARHRHPDLAALDAQVVADQPERDQPDRGQSERPQGEAEGDLRRRRAVNLAVLPERPGAAGGDSHADALDVARRNAVKHGLEIELRQGKALPRPITPSSSRGLIVWRLMTRTLIPSATTR